MEVAVPPDIVADVLGQLRRQNAQAGAFREVTADYQACLQRARELQVGGQQGITWGVLRGPRRSQTLAPALRRCSSQPGHRPS